MKALPKTTGWLIVLLTLIGLGFVPQAWAGMPSGATLPPEGVAAGTSVGNQDLGALLNPDGTLRTDTGFSGSLQVSGWQMSTTASGAPRFTPTAAEPGDEQWDDRFGPIGANDDVTAIAVDDDGTIYIGGEFTGVGGIAASRIAYWNGQRWGTLGNGLRSEPTQIVFGHDGMYVIGDYLLPGENITLAHWDGSAWSAVTNQSIDINTMVMSGSDLYVGGYFGQIGDVSVNSIARWDGSAWHALDSGITRGSSNVYGFVYALAVDGDDLYVGGDFTRAGALPAESLARWDGTAWHALEAGGVNGSVTALAFSADTLYVGGEFTEAGGQAAASIASWDGTVWRALGAGLKATYGSAEVYALVVNGAMLTVAGDFSRAGDQVIATIAQWDGTTWSAPGWPGGLTGGYRPIQALAITPEGHLLVGGNFGSVDGIYFGGLGLWDNTKWQAIGVGGVQYTRFGTYDQVYALTLDPTGKLYVGGSFEYAGQVYAKNIAMWDGQRWASLGEGSNDDVRALVFAEGALYAAGDFTQIGTVGANRIARWDPATQTWSALGSGINGPVHALAYADGILYAGGNFTAAGTVLTNDVAYWDGTNWHAFGDDFQIYEINPIGWTLDTYVAALAVVGDLVFVGGEFRTLLKVGADPEQLSSYIEVNNLAVWNRSNSEWYLVGPRTNSIKPGVIDTSSPYARVNALLINGRSLYVGGIFNQAGSVAVANLVRFDLMTLTWQSIGGVGGFVSPYRNEVHTLGTTAEHLYVGGHFTTAETTTARFVARMDLRTGTWSKLGSGLAKLRYDGRFDDNYTYVYSLAVGNEGIYVGGNFNLAGSTTALSFARWAAPQVEQALTAAANTLDTADGLKLSVPTAALTDSIVVRYSALFKPSQPAPSGMALVRAFRFTATDSAQQPITTFSHAYTLRVPYSLEQLAFFGISDPSQLNLAYWDGTAWQTMLPCTGCRVDTSTNEVVVVADHFTEFALIGPLPIDQSSVIFLPFVSR